jgi:hypothetical protein
MLIGINVGHYDYPRRGNHAGLSRMFKMPFLNCSKRFEPALLIEGTVAKRNSGSTTIEKLDPE